MKEEVDSLEKNQTWELVSKPKDQRINGSKWIFKRKEGIPGLVEKPRCKARLVAKCYSEIEGLDFHEIFSTVVKHKSKRSITSIVAKKDLELKHLDVKRTFLHGDLEEVICMTQHECSKLQELYQCCAN